MCGHLIGLAQHCCKPLFSSQKSLCLVLGTHVWSWTSIPQNTNSPVCSGHAPVLKGGVSELLCNQSNFLGVCRRASSGTVVGGLSRNRSDSRGVSRMSTTVNASQTESTRETEQFTFGQWKIDSREVFLVTKHCYCFVNLRPVVPDVLVTTKKLVPRFTDLSGEEVIDLWLTAQRVGRKIEPFFNGTSLNLAIQDGPEAGQTVPHVHVHVLPRKKRDFENNDEVYDQLDIKEKELNDAKREEEKHLNLDVERKDRTREEMFEEASKLRALFQ